MTTHTWKDDGWEYTAMIESPLMNNNDCGYVTRKRLPADHFMLTDEQAALIGCEGYDVRVQMDESESDSGRGWERLRQERGWLPKATRYPFHGSVIYRKKKGGTE